MLRGLLLLAVFASAALLPACKSAQCGDGPTELLITVSASDSTRSQVRTLNVSLHLPDQVRTRSYSVNGLSSNGESIAVDLSPLISAPESVLAEVHALDASGNELASAEQSVMISTNACNAVALALVAGVMDAGVDAGPTDLGVTDAPVVDTGSRDAGSPESGPADAPPDDGMPRDLGVTDTGTTDAGMTDNGMTDTGATDLGTPDSGLPACPGMQVIDLNAMGTTSGSTTTGLTTTYVGNNSTAGLISVPEPMCALITGVSNEAVFKYTLQTSTRVAIDDGYMGLTGFTALSWAFSSCTQTIADEGCASSTGMTYTTHFTSSGRAIYIVLATKSGTPGPYGLSVHELPVIGPGGTCDPMMLTNTCQPNYDCQNGVCTFNP
jgi:hypothetical protein